MLANRLIGLARGGDPYWTDVQSLLHFDGSNGSTTFTDEKSVSWSAAGSASLSTSAPKFGTAALLLGSGDNYITTTAGSGTWADFSTAGDYTVDMWIKARVNPQSCALFAHLFSGVGSKFPLTIAFGKVGTTTLSTEMYVGYFNGSWVGANSTWSPTLDTWHHIACTRDGTLIRLFAAGTQIASFDSSSSPPVAPTSSTFRLGRRWDSGLGTQWSFDGQIDDWRVTRGTARYTSNFTPPTAPFPNG